jgi:hypothetical protein
MSNYNNNVRDNSSQPTAIHSNTHLNDISSIPYFMPKSTFGSTSRSDTPNSPATISPIKHDRFTHTEKIEHVSIYLITSFFPSKF